MLNAEVLDTLKNDSSDYFKIMIILNAVIQVVIMINNNQLASPFDDCWVHAHDS